MPLCDETLAWMALAHAPALDAAQLAAALETVGTVGAMLEASDAELRAAGLSARTCRHLRSAVSRPGAAERRWLDQADHHLVPCLAAEFPERLRTSTACPLALYVAGNRAALLAPQLAVVGSRNPTPQGAKNAFELAGELCGAGLAIASGLALGIDAAAHRGALAAQGTTLAVLGSGVDLVYPRSHRDLAANIVCAGALVSSFPLGTPPRRAQFPQRNRLLATMTLGTIVVEAALGSGSLSTARAAARAKRSLFALPGSLQNPLSRGCHQLIKQGASLVEGADDILRALDLPRFSRRSARGEKPCHGAAPPASGMDKDRKILLDALGFDPADLDTLVVRTGLEPNTVSSMMLILELEGHVQAAPAGRYLRVAGRRAGGER